MVLCLCPNPSVDTYAWLNSFQSGTVNRFQKIVKYAGGKGTHVAIGLNRLGEEVTLLGAWAGNTGQWIQTECEQMGIAPIGPILGGENRTCYTIRSKNRKLNHTELIEPGPTMSSNDWDGFMKTFQEYCKQATLVCASGSWPKGAPENAYQQLIQVANHLNTPFLLDCSGTQLNHALKESFFGLHINEQEASDQFGTTSISEIHQQIGQRVSLIALTKGKDGLDMVHNQDFLRANVSVEPILSTVGSGDCLTAGLAHAVINQKSKQEVAAYGVACGAANCIYEGLGMFEPNVVQTLIQKATVKQLENA